MEKNRGVKGGHCGCDEFPGICPRHPLPKKSYNKLVALGVLIISSAAVIGYAKVDKDFRCRVTERFPFVDEIVKVVFQEKKSYYQSLSDVYEELKKYIKSEK